MKRARRGIFREDVANLPQKLHILRNFSFGWTAPQAIDLLDKYKDHEPDNKKIDQCCQELAIGEDRMACLLGGS